MPSSANPHLTDGGVGLLLFFFRTQIDALIPKNEPSNFKTLGSRDKANFGPRAWKLKHLRFFKWDALVFWRPKVPWFNSEGLLPQYCCEFCFTFEDAFCLEILNIYNLLCIVENRKQKFYFKEGHKNTGHICNWQQNKS